MSASFGVGGAVISTPAIRVLGASAFVAVGTTLPSILPSAASGTARYVREHLVDWEVVRWTAPIGVVASIAGSLLSHAVPGHGLEVPLADGRTVVCSFHPSQQNTFTGKLTEDMFDRVFQRARALISPAA